MLGNKMCGATLLVAHHKHIGVHGNQVVDRIKNGFTLGLRGGTDIEVKHVC
ncbi:hypothetical protein D3C86_2156060 [compost metagenome]